MTAGKKAGFAWRSCLLCSLIAVEPLMAGGKIKGNAGGIERGASVFNSSGQLMGWTVTGPSGLYEFADLAPGDYLMLINGAIAPYVRVVEGRTTVVDQANQPGLDFEQELWTPARVRFAQSFVASGTAVTGFSLWRASGDGKLLVSLYEESPAGKRIAGPFETGAMNWICWSDLPAEEFVITPGRRYALELAAADGKPWNHATPRRGDVYPDGIAYFDGKAHPESDLGISIHERRPGLRRMAAAGDDLHYIAEGPGSGTCTVAGQTFIATAPTAIRAYANCGFNDGVQQFIFTLHEDGPGGTQIGPPCHTRMVPNWGSEVVWFPGAVTLTPGRKYYLEYRRADNKPFFSYLSSNVYAEGRALRDGKMLEERFDQLFSIDGEDEAGGVTYPYNVQVSELTGRTARITWQSGTPGDGLVHYGLTSQCSLQAGSTAERTADHEVRLTNLEPGTLYLYRVSTDTHKQSSRRTYSRVYSFMTRPEGPDRPRHDQHRPPAPSPPCDDCIALANPGFEDGTQGWTRSARAGKVTATQPAVANCEPLGASTTGVDGFGPLRGQKAYGWAWFGREDPTWQEPREDWKREIVRQRIRVVPGGRYALTAWLLTGDRGSGWGRDSRVRLLVDEADAGLLDRFDTADQANATQWFATRYEWLPVSLHFTAQSEHVTVGVEFFQWWALEANYLFVDEVSVRPVN